jgi:hypothetical protein
MRVVLKSNFDVGGLPGQDALELQEGCSMRSLLDLLSQQCRVNLIDPKSGRVNVTDFTLILNGKEYPFWPQGLDTRLRAADEVQIFLMPLGGG